MAVLEDDVRMSVEIWTAEVFRDWTYRWLTNFNDLVYNEHFSCISHDTGTFINDNIKIKLYPKSKEALDKIRDGAINVFNKLQTSLTFGIDFYSRTAQKYNLDNPFVDYYMGCMDVRRQRVIQFIEYLTNYRDYINRTIDKDLCKYREELDVVLGNITLMMSHGASNYYTSKDTINKFYNQTLHLISNDKQEYKKDRDYRDYKEDKELPYFGKDELVGHLRLYAYDDLRFVYNYLKDIGMMFYNNLTTIHPLIIQSFISHVGNKLVTDVLCDFIDTHGRVIDTNNLYMNNYILSQRYNFKNEKD